MRRLLALASAIFGPGGDLESVQRIFIGPDVPTDARKTIECRECHMPLQASDDAARGDDLDYNRSARDGKHRSHRFLGANQFMPLALPLEGAQEHVDLTDRWLQGRIDVPEIAHKWRTGPAVPIELVAPAEARPGDEVRLAVVITNNKVGHDFPTGPLDIIQSWIEVVVRDPARAPQLAGTEVATATYADVLRSAGVPSVLVVMARGVTGGGQVHNQGTIGGSFCYANPASDAPGALVGLLHRAVAREDVVPVDDDARGHEHLAAPVAHVAIAEVAHLGILERAPAVEQDATLPDDWDPATVGDQETVEDDYDFGVLIADLPDRQREVADVRRADGGIGGRGEAGEPLSFTGAELVSMNLWGFRRHALTALSEQFGAFLDARGPDPESEFLLPDAAGGQVAAGRARLQVLAAPDRWFGLTFADDLPLVRAALAELVRAGVYPDDLRAGFARL